MQRLLWGLVMAAVHVQDEGVSTMTKPIGTHSTQKKKGFDLSKYIYPQIPHQVIATVHIHHTQTENKTTKTNRGHELYLSRVVDETNISDPLG